MNKKQCFNMMQQAISYAVAKGESKTLYMSAIGNFEIVVKPIVDIKTQDKEEIKEKFFWLDESSEITEETWGQLEALFNTTKA